MNKSASDRPRINIGDTVELSSIVLMPGILQLSFGTSYEVVNVGRANNPNNDHIYVRNDHGRVTYYLARVFQKVDKWLMVATDDGIFLGVHMIYVTPYGKRIIILALPGHPVEYPEELAGIVLLDETGLRRVGALDLQFGRDYFREIR